MIGVVLSLKAALSMMLLRFVLLDGVIGDQEVVVEKFASFSLSYLHPVLIAMLVRLASLRLASDHTTLQPLIPCLMILV